MSPALVHGFRSPAANCTRRYNPAPLRGEDDGFHGFRSPAANCTRGYNPAPLRGEFNPADGAHRCRRLPGPIAIGQQMFDLHKQVSAAKTPHEQAALQRQVSGSSEHWWASHQWHPPASAA